MRPFLIIGYLIACVVIAAVGDGVFDDGAKGWGHILEAIETLMLVSGPFIFRLKRRQWLAYVIALVAFRIGFFDYTYNLVRGLPLAFVGSTSWWDMLIAKQYPHGLLFGRIIFLILACSLPFQHLYKID